MLALSLNSLPSKESVQAVVWATLSVALKALIELVKMAATTAFITLMTLKQFRNSKDLTERVIVCVLGPVIEEVIFRGFVQRGIGLVQHIWNSRITQRELTEEEISGQQRFRILAASFIFAAAHLKNDHDQYHKKLVQFTWCWVSSYWDGHISEKYSSLAPAILLHGINNFLVSSMIEYPSAIHKYTCGMLGLGSTQFIVGCTDWADDAARCLKESSIYVLTLPGRALNGILRNEQVIIDQVV